MSDATPDSARRYTKDVADLYGDAVAAILRQIADRVARGVDEGPLLPKLSDLLTLRKQAQQIASRVGDQLDGTVADTIAQAYAHGVDQGASNLATALGYRDELRERQALDTLTATKASTVHGLARGLGDTLRDLPITRAAEDAYRSTIAAAITPAAAGVETRRQAAQRALDRLAAQGIGNFTDKAGRRWRIETYAEMATRTALGQAATQGTVDRIRQTTPFVQVSDQADECERCRPWEGKVLVVGPIPEKWADVEYDGTLADARSGGLFHPNCTHALSAFIPGLTRRRQGRANPKGDASRQEQRRLERGLRDWKRRSDVAITPTAKTLADRKIAEWSQRLAEHTDKTKRLRLSAREAPYRPKAPKTPTPLDELPTIPQSDLDLAPFRVTAAHNVDVPDQTPDTGGGFFDETPAPEPTGPRHPSVMSDDELDAEVGDLMAAGDFGDRLETLTLEMDIRQQDAAIRAQIPDTPDPLAELQAVQDALEPERRKRRAANRDKAIRDDYDTWAYTQWLRAEEETRGNLLNREGTAKGVNPVGFFDGSLRPAQVRKYAAEELLRWFAESPGNGRLSFDEFRAAIVDDKRGREARRRQSDRGYLSEFG